MPLLPIDLQTIFSHMDNVGKDQAAVKNGIVGSQSMQANEIVKKSEEQDKSVNQAKDIADGVRKLNDENEEKQRKRDLEEKAKKKQENSAPKQVFQDPELGQHVDISG